MVGKKKSDISNLDEREDSRVSESDQGLVTVGLDISTTCIGVCGLNSKGNVILFYPITFEKDEDSLYKKTDYFIEKMKELLNNLTPSSFNIEEPLKKFKSRLSSAEVLHRLQSFNSMCRYAIYKEFGIAPILYNVNTLRSKLGLIIDKKDKTVSTKEKVRTATLALYPDLPIVKKIITKGKNKGKNLPIKTMEDCIDAFVVAKASSLFDIKKTSKNDKTKK